MSTKTTEINQEHLSFIQFKNEVLLDYKTALLSRECSLLGRKEVLSGKAQFGIFGDGKELPQLAMAKYFQKGDFRSGYYRDQTFMMASNLLTAEHIFSALYATPDIKVEPMSAGRQMGAHFATHSLNENGSWKDLTAQKNSSSDLSCTGAQMPRLVGLAQASKIYRSQDQLKHKKTFSNNGNEIAWGTIGNGSTSEGVFFECINAAGVLQVPMVISIWDDDYAISVSNKIQTTKGSISKILQGFQRTNTEKGIEIMEVNGWDYVHLVDVYQKAAKVAREKHIPVLIHVKELTQPLGHSTSGSHERYKTKERLQWEKEHDCLAKMRAWILDFELEDNNGSVLKFVENESQLTALEEEAKTLALQAKNTAWETYKAPLKEIQSTTISLLKSVASKSKQQQQILNLCNELVSTQVLARHKILRTVRKTFPLISQENFPEKIALQKWTDSFFKDMHNKYSATLYNDTENGITKVLEIEPTYNTESTLVDGRIIIRDNFDTLLNLHPEILIFGQDCGQIGDVNQGLEGLQKKYGKIRVADVGIRETSIIGQGIGMALRGLRPIAEVQYLDYLIYCLQILSDDLSTLRYRTFGKQTAPLIVRTRGHRLEGIFHSGSPMQAILGTLRGMCVLVPRNMTKAAGFYNTLLESDEPGIVIECLNGYRLKEKLPNNIGKFRTPVGVVETVKEGSDMTIVSYGSTFRIVEKAAETLTDIGIEVELIDVQSLLPFDIHHDISKSLQKTNRLLIVDEDVPGGASAYILQHVIDTQNSYQYLDSKPTTLSAKAHRPAYGSDGDYFSKPSHDDIFEAAYNIMHEVAPQKFPKLY